jgi:mercuric ion binding protein
MKQTIQKIALVTLLGLVPNAAFAEEVTVTVKGMVCSFCAQGIKKTFGKKEDVKAIDVDLEHKIVKLDLKDGSLLSDKEIEETIKDSGYDVEKIERAKNA